MSKLIYRSVLICILLVALSIQISDAQYLRTSKEAPVHGDSLSSADIISRVDAGTPLPLLDKTGLYGTGYWKVELSSGRIGYIYKTHVRLMEGEISDSYLSNTTGGELQVHMINVGQADAILIVCPGGKHQMVIDAGELNFRYPGSSQEFKNYITAYQAESDPIEVVIATHPDADHIASMEWLIRKYETGVYVDNGRIHDSNTFRSLEVAIAQENINRQQLAGPEVPQIDFCTRQDVTARILRPQGFNNPGMEPNDYSVVVRIDYDNSSFLFTGDVEEEMEELLLSDTTNTLPFLNVDWLKVPHHGSDTSSSPDFIEVVSPQIAVISSGGETIGTNSNNRHPRMVTLNTLFPFVREREGISTTLEAYNDSTDQWSQIETEESVYITNNQGDLVFLSDGERIWKLGDYY